MKNLILIVGLLCVLTLSAGAKTDPFSTGLFADNAPPGRIVPRLEAAAQVVQQKQDLTQKVASLYKPASELYRLPILGQVGLVLTAAGLICLG